MVCHVWPIVFISHFWPSDDAPLKQGHYFAHSSIVIPFVSQASIQWWWWYSSCTLRDIQFLSLTELYSVNRVSLYTFWANNSEVFPRGQQFFKLWHTKKKSRLLNLTKLNIWWMAKSRLLNLTKINVWETAKETQIDQILRCFFTHFHFSSS